MKLHLFVIFVCLLCLSSGKKDQEGDKRKSKIVKKAIKKASEIEKKILNVLESVKNLDKKSHSEIFSEYSEVMEKVINNFPKCTAEAQNAYNILQNCKTTVPSLCSPPNVSIKIAEECIDEKTSSFVRFLKCISESEQS